ncbi:two-component system sensor histidine kinase NtrB [Acinetobacter schindleri]|uniref:two-component system sensor histidine kinase NtrB n=1 Tax=Acinetobacter schindleri TaxID=108981 RepID=UPI002DC01547|nr:ATP-binding protein [Acinetobacter schindleri]MEB5930026.1 ATP-binding protein [Acinetobacter schindleri]
MSQRSSYSELNQYLLGTWYAAYRLIISTGLLLIFVLTYPAHTSDLEYPKLYHYVLSSFIAIALIQLFVLKYFKKFVQQQLTGIFIVDVCALSLLTLATNGTNLQLSMLFVITIFAASILLNAQKALVITLIAVISVIYQHFITSLLTLSSLGNIGNSAILAFMFFVVYGIGQIAVRRFQILENVNFSQSMELYRLQNINRYILEQIETGYLVLDENCHVVLSNPAACHLLGIQQMYAHDTFPLYQSQPDLFELIRFEDLENGERFQFESQQSRFNIHVQVQKLIVPHQTLMLLVLQDARKLNQQVQQLKLAALGQLSASIAHEIRNPLAAIVQANDLLPGCEQDQQQVLHGMISKQATRINRIIEDTLNMVKNKETHPVSIQLNEFIPQCIHEDLADIADQIKLNIDMRLDIQFDEAQLRQVLVNLLRNAVRHNDPAVGYVELKVHPYEHKVWIDVRDFGQGVAPADQSLLFKPFFSTSINGTGLGLYLSHSFCEANQAQLNYIQQEQGACFRISCQRITV